MDKAIIQGVGPIEGLGGQLCLRFAGEGLHVFVAGRTEAKVAAVARAVADSGGQATPVVADATSEVDTQRLFETARSTGDGDIQLALYNVGNNTPGRIDEMTAEYFETSWRVCCFGGFLFGREAVREMKGRGGALLFTGASASMRGRANFGAFNSSKAGLRTLAQALAKEYAEDGIHVGHVVVDGPIGGEKIKTRFPDLAEQMGEEGMISLEGLADAFVYLYRQRPQAWTFEVDVRTSRENW